MSNLTISCWNTLYKQISSKAYSHNKNLTFRVFGDFELILKCKFFLLRKL